MGFTKKHLSAEELHRIVRQCFYRENFPGINSSISWLDCSMSGLAIFGLKFPSLLQFEEHKLDPFIKHNLKSLYHIQRVPSDTCLRERLDVLSLKHFRSPFGQPKSKLNKTLFYQESMPHYIKVHDKKFSIANPWFSGQAVGIAESKKELDLIVAKQVAGKIEQNSV